MFREQVRAEVEAIEPLDALEREHQADVLAGIDSGAELFRVANPATPPKHLVASFAVVDGDHILLVDPRDARLWLPTGGHVEAELAGVRWFAFDDAAWKRSDPHWRRFIAKLRMVRHGRAGRCVE